MALTKKNGLIPTPEFSEDLLTTRTVLYEFNNEINLTAIAQTLPLTTIVFDKPWKRSTKPKLKNFPALGTIYSIRLLSICRGVYGPYFKNSLMVDLSLGNKSVNIKISKRTIHICGIKEEQKHGDYIATLLANHIKEADQILQLLPMQSSIQEFYTWIKESTKSDESITRQTYVTERTKIKDKHKLRKKITGEETVEKYLPFSVDQACSKFPLLNEKVILFFSQRFKECEAYKDMIRDLTYFESNPQLRTIIGSNGNDLKLTLSPRHVMINCSYTLGFCILKTELRNIINTTQTEFIAHFNNASDHYVNVELLCSEDEVQDPNMVISEKKNVVAHTFIVYESGHVMQSSKMLNGMKDAFYKFRSLIDSIKPQIIDEDSTNEEKSKINSTTKEGKKKVKLIQDNN